MPQGGRPKRSKEPCPVCENSMFEIWHNDGFGQQELLETHCNRCGAAWDPEGRPRQQPHNEGLLESIGKIGTQITPLRYRR